MTDFAQLPLDKISVHPRNIRRDVGVDDEMVASITANGLVTALTVAPAGDGYVLIGGHRRLVNAREAGLTVVPAMIRTDLVTDGQHIEAMAIENIQRTDLTAVEEADAYEQLQLVGYTQEQITAATGRSASTVASRLKLTKLPEPARDAVHTGQMTLADAAAVAELDDYPAIRDELLEHISEVGTDNWSWRLTSAQQSRKQEIHKVVTAGKIADSKVKKATAKQVEKAYETDVSQLVDTKTGERLTREKHATCKGHRIYGVTSVQYLCTDPAKYGHTVAWLWRRPADDSAEATPEQKDAARLRDGVNAADRARRAFVVDHVSKPGAAQVTFTQMVAARADAPWDEAWTPTTDHVVEAAIAMGSANAPDGYDPAEPRFTREQLRICVRDLVEGEAETLQAWVAGSLFNELEVLKVYSFSSADQEWSSEYAEPIIAWLNAAGYEWTDIETEVLALVEAGRAEDAA